MSGRSRRDRIHVKNISPATVPNEPQEQLQEQLKQPISTASGNSVLGVLGFRNYHLCLLRARNSCHVNAVTLPTVRKSEL
jgi:hypothetical protein